MADAKTSKADQKSSYTQPVKRVVSPADLPLFKSSKAFQHVMNLIIGMTSAVEGKTRSTPRTLSTPVTKIVSQLKLMKDWIREIPPEQQSQRFGNKAFRRWHAKLVETAPEFLSNLIGGPVRSSLELSSSAPQGPTAVDELLVYWVESFGNPQRIDYGTGHELNFVAWLAALTLVPTQATTSASSSASTASSSPTILTAADRLALVLDVVWQYLDVLREIQSVYWLEPAGSKGVWGLDDYQFLPFLWGSSQLVGYESTIPPSQLCNPSVYERESEEFLFFDCIKFVCKMKRGPFFEHSPLLHSLSTGVSYWSKVRSGLAKMYEAEVLDKFPVIQHFFFGSLLAFEPTGASAEGGKPPGAAVTAARRIPPPPTFLSSIGVPSSSSTPSSEMGFAATIRPPPPPTTTTTTTTTASTTSAAALAVQQQQVEVADSSSSGERV